MDRKLFELSRREFLRRTLALGYGVGLGGLWLPGCGSGKGGIRPPAPDTTGGTDVMADLGGHDDDVHEMDANTPEIFDDAHTDDAHDAFEELVEPLAPITITKGPWIQFVGPRTARMRFETLDPAPRDVELVLGASSTTFRSAVSHATLSYKWPTYGATRPSFVKYFDDPGDYTIHEVLFTNLQPGERYTWIIDRNGEETRGSFLANPERGTAFRIGWMSDTMLPNAEQTLPHLAAFEPDLVLHGGDIQYQTNPLDTWTGFFATAAALTSRAATHFVIGNHEYEEQDEFNVMYSRLFGNQGHEGGNVDWYAFTFGGIRFIVLNSEVDMGTTDGAQLRWLKAELAAADADPAIRHSVIAFHRPYFCFSKSFPKFDVRDAVHAILKEHKVPLVLSGHNHCYERFEVDGIQYVNDGGGGAFDYDPDDNRDRVLAQRPGDEVLRKKAERTLGTSHMAVDADGTIRLRRVTITGAVTEELEIGAP